MNYSFACPRLRTLAACVLISLLVWSSPGAAQDISQEQPIANDVHFHLTNYIQEGTDIHDFLKIMGDKVGRVGLFGIPLQQQWSYRVDGDRAPSYYLHLYELLSFYSLADVWLAMH